MVACHRACGDSGSRVVGAAEMGLCGIDNYSAFGQISAAGKNKGISPPDARQPRFHDI